MEVAVASAALNFNDGNNGILRVMKECGITPGHYAVVTSAKQNTVRVTAMNRKSTETVKLTRKRARAVAKGYADKEKEKEPTYVPGGF